MAKKLFKRFLPDSKSIQKNKYLKIFGKFLHNPSLWGLNRHSAATACTIGLFITFIPLPGHMLLAALLAIIFRANLPISLALVWIVNPLTIIPLFGFAFTLGAMILGISIYELDFRSLAILGEAWLPLTIGCLICGTVLGTASNIVVRIIWRYSVAKRWHERQERRLSGSTISTITETSLL